MKSNQKRLETQYSEEAESDIDNINQYTLQEWGENQMHKYASILDDGFDSIEIAPDIGNERPDVPSAYLTHPAGKHIIVYKRYEDHILIVRILHCRMDFRKVDWEL